MELPDRQIVPDEGNISWRDKIAESVFLQQKCAKSVYRKHVESEVIERKVLNNKHLLQSAKDGGGGIRTQNVRPQNLYN